MSNRTKAVPKVAVLAALAVTATTVMLGGGYDTADLVAMTALLAAAAAVNRVPISDADWRVAQALALFAAAWLVRGVIAGTTARAASLAGAAIAFGAAYLLARSCRTRDERVVLTRLLVFIGVGVAAISLVLWASHTTPWGLPYDGVWRLGGPFAYPNAAGLFFALASLANLARNERRWIERVVCSAVLLGALLASQSRGGVLAFGIGLLVLGRREFYARTAWREAFNSVATGAVVVCVVYIALLTSGVVGNDGPRSATGSMNDRVAEWSAAARQGGENLLFGAGPERDLHIHNFRGDAMARFAHNEALQVFAGLGITGVALLAVFVAAVIAALRDPDGPRGRVAAASLAAFAVGGLLDFTWHFVALAAFAGWLAGLDEDEPATE